MKDFIHEYTVRWRGGRKFMKDFTLEEVPPKKFTLTRVVR